MNTAQRWRTTGLLSGVALIVVMLASVAAAQTESRRLDQLAQDVRAELRRADQQPSGDSARFVAELESVRDEIGYLRVLERRGQRIQDSQIRDLELRLQNVRRDARNAGRVYNEDRVGVRGSGDEIPAGTELDVRLSDRLYSDTAKVEDRFQATTAVDLYQGDRLVVPAGSVLGGVVTSVDRASRTDRRGSLTVVFDTMTVRGRTHDIRASVSQAIESEGIQGELPRIGAGAGVGAIIGGILGGVKGALAGILIGAGGTVLATEGKDVDLPPGTTLRVRFDSPVFLDR